MLPDEKKMCHLTGFKKYCRKLVVGGYCQNRWIGVQGQHPQTGETISSHGCVDDQLVVLQLDQTRKLNGLQAAVESMRNENVKLQSQMLLQSEQHHRETLALTVETQMRIPELLPGYVDQLALELKSED